MKSSCLARGLLIVALSLALAAAGQGAPSRTGPASTVDHAVGGNFLVRWRSLGDNWLQRITSAWHTI
jgi:hypothetical protein